MMATLPLFVEYIIERNIMNDELIREKLIGEKQEREIRKFLDLMLIPKLINSI
jgi:hypothetical protein